MEEFEVYLPIVISVFALLVSFATLWLSRMRRGTIKMTRPSVIFFGKDGGSKAAKIFLRTLLYSTADKGQYIESMYIKLTRTDITTAFSIWTYGEAGKIKRGSGLFVGKQGVEADHHFLLPRQASLEFKAGDYVLDVYVELVGKKTKRIWKQHLTISKKEAKALKPIYAGLYFDWQPEMQEYETYVDDRTQEVYARQVSESLGFRRR
jgi:hypothetical protein